LDLLPLLFPDYLLHDAYLLQLLLRLAARGPRPFALLFQSRPELGKGIHAKDTGVVLLPLPPYGDVECWINRRVTAGTKDRPLTPVHLPAIDQRPSRSQYLLNDARYLRARSGGLGRSRRSYHREDAGKSGERGSQCPFLTCGTLPGRFSPVARLASIHTWTGVAGKKQNSLAERHGNRTHPGRDYRPTPVLKTDRANARSCLLVLSRVVRSPQIAGRALGERVLSCVLVSFSVPSRGLSFRTRSGRFR
jgi:hypothetical protein